MTLVNDMKYKLTYLTLTLLVTACGGGSSTTGPDVSSTTPVNEAINVSRDTSVTATFDDDMIASTIDDASFTLSNTGSVSGSVSFDAVTNIATLDPDSDLTLMTTYTATLGVDITNLDGDALEEYSWSFTTVDGAWGTAQKIEAEDTNDIASDTTVAADPDGNAIVIWSQNGDNDVWSNYYDASTGTWEDNAVLVEQDDVDDGGVSAPSITMTDDGIGVAVWSQTVSDTPDTQHIYVNRYTPDVGWGTEEAIEANPAGDNANNPEAAVDSSGNIIVVWEQPNNSIDSIWVNRYSESDEAWGTAQEIDTTDNVINTSSDPQIAVADNGDAMAIWSQDVGGTSYDAIYTSYYSANDDSWSTPEIIGKNLTTGITPKISADNSGNFIAVWEQSATDVSDGTRSIWSNLYTDDAWGTAEEIESEPNTAKYPQVAFDANGNAISTWAHNNSIYANIYTADTGWGTGEAIESDSEYAYNPMLAVDPEGNAIIVWKQNSESVQSTWANRYQTSNGWGTAELLETDDTNPATNLVVAIGDTGTGIAAWQQSDGVTESMFAANFE